MSSNLYQTETYTRRTTASGRRLIRGLKSTSYLQMTLEELRELVLATQDYHPRSVVNLEHNYAEVIDKDTTRKLTP